MKKFSILFLILAGCSSYPLKPGANKVVIQEEGPVSANCKFLKVEQTDPETFSADRNKALSDFKNKAVELGGNLVSVSRVAITGAPTKRAWWNLNPIPSNVTDATVNYVGKIYSCNSIDLIN